MFKSKNKFYLVGTVLLWLVMIVGTIVSTRIVQQSADNRGKATDSIHDYSDCRRLPSGSYFCGGTRGGTPCEPDLTKGGDYCIENGVSVPCSSIGRIRCQCNNGVWVVGSEGQDCSGLCGATNNVCNNGSCNNPTETPPPPTSPPTVKPPTATPTKKPSATPTKKPSATPTKKPSATPTIKPTVTPTKVPTATPTIKLSPTPTDVITPTFEPTNTVTPNPTATNTPEPTATPTNQPTATPTTKPQTCGYSPCNSANLICSNGLVCIQASDNNNYCSKPELTNNCSVNPGYDGCCLGITNTPAPTRVIAEGPTPTIVILPEAGFEFPATATVILGMITALVGLFIIL